MLGGFVSFLEQGSAFALFAASALGEISLELVDGNPQLTSTKISNSLTHRYISTMDRQLILPVMERTKIWMY